MSGYRCRSTQGSSVTTQSSTTAALSECVECFFPKHCLANNTCLSGTAGPTCEHCLSPGYQLVGSTCVECSQVPASAAMFVVFLISISLCAALTRHSSAAVTKIKILVNFLQHVYLSLFIKVNWSRLIGQLASFLSFSTFTSDLAMTECLLRSVKISSYIRWLTAFLVPCFFLCLGICVDRGFGRKMRSAKDEGVRVGLEKRRHDLRHFVFLVLLLYYMPVTLSAAQSFSCTATFGQKHVFHPEQGNVFLYDSSVSCDEFLLQTFNFVLTVAVVLYSILLPLLVIFFTLRQKKWSLLHSNSAKFGFVYDSYTNGMCFWEALAMIRTGVTVGVTITVLTHSFLQSVVLLSMSGLYLLLLLLARPFRPCCWRNSTLNLHMLQEVVCSVCVCVFHVGALLLSLDLYPAQLDILLVSVLILPLVLWLLTALTGRLQDISHTQQVEERELAEVVHVKPQQRIKRNQVGEYLTTQETHRRTAQTAF